MDADILVRLERLSVRYGQFAAITNLDLAIRGGEIVGLVGPNGAGKSTTLRVLVGQRRPDAGRVAIAGHDVVHDWRAIKPVIGYVPDHDSHFEEFTGRRNLAIFSGLYGVPRDRVEECLRLVELTAAADLPVGQYSLGMRRKLLIARALLHEPLVLLLDEPTANLDEHSAAIVRRLLQNHAVAGGATLLTTHDLSEVEEICNRVAVLHQGRLVACDSPAALAREQGRRMVDVVMSDGRRHSVNLDSANERRELAARIEANDVANMRTRESGLRAAFLALTDTEDE